MATMKWNIEALRNQVQKPLNMSYSKLEGVADSLSMINVPSDFSGAEELVSIISNINDVRENIVSIRKKILDIATRLEKAERRNQEILDLIYSLFLQEMEDGLHTIKELEQIMMGTPEAVITMAEFLKQQQTDWLYTSDYSDLHGDGGLVYEDIEKSLNNPKKATCCSTYVAQALYLAGYFTEDQMNGKDENYEKDFGYNYQVHLQQMLKHNEWEKITDESELKAGDVVFTGKSKYKGPEHVQIYAGDYEWYNAGNTEDIQTLGKTVKKNNDGEELRTMKDILKHESRTYWVAYRPPNLVESAKNEENN